MLAPRPTRHAAGSTEQEPKRHYTRSHTCRLSQVRLCQRLHEAPPRADASRRAVACAPYGRAFTTHRSTASTPQRHSVEWEGGDRRWAGRASREGSWGWAGARIRQRAVEHDASQPPKEASAFSLRPLAFARSERLGLVASPLGAVVLFPQRRLGAPRWCCVSVQLPTGSMPPYPRGCARLLAAGLGAWEG